MANLAAVGIKVPGHPEWRQHTELPLLVMQGFAESMAPGILGFSLLSLTALACAVGFSRSLRLSLDESSATRREAQ